MPDTVFRVPGYIYTAASPAPPIRLLSYGSRNRRLRRSERNGRRAVLYSRDVTFADRSLVSRASSRPAYCPAARRIVRNFVLSGLFLSSVSNVKNKRSNYRTRDVPKWRELSEITAARFYVRLVTWLRCILIKHTHSITLLLASDVSYRVSASVHVTSWRRVTQYGNISPCSDRWYDCRESPETDDTIDVSIEKRFYHNLDNSSGSVKKAPPIVRAPKRIGESYSNFNIRQKIPVFPPNRSTPHVFTGEIVFYLRR